MLFQNVNVAEISVGGAVGDHARETDLRFPVKHSEAERVGDSALHCFSRDALRPVGANQAPMNRVKVKFCRIGGD